MDFHTGEYDWNLSKLFRCDRRDNCRYNYARVCVCVIRNCWRYEFPQQFRSTNIDIRRARVYKEVEEKSSFHHVYWAVRKVIPFFRTVRR